VGFRDEVIPPLNYLAVSSDVYNVTFGDRRIIAVEVDSRGVYEGTYREPIIDARTAMLDRLMWVSRTALDEQSRATARPPARTGRGDYSPADR
jgi:hypothetical protein